MVTPNVQSLSDSFDTIVSERDVASVGVLGLAGATGGVIATQIAGRISPLVGLPQQPTDLPGLFANGLIKMLVGLGLGFAAVQVGGTPGVVLAIAGLGPLVLGGGDWINALLSTSAGVPGAQTARQTYGGGNASARVVSNSQPTTVQADEETVGFRNGSAGGGGAAATAGSSSFR